MAVATGGCMCGTVRYECSAAPVFMGNCHCHDCQRASGAAYAALIAVPQSAIKITGNVKYYESIADSGKPIKRAFCPNCGSRLFGLPSVLPDVTVITAASLDDPSIFKPGADFFVASAQPWDYMNPAVQKFPKGPPRESISVAE
jgi:hypothetical protein